MALAVLGSAQLADATPGINSEINYQARLLNSAGATVPDGTYNIEFQIYAGGNGCVGGGSSPCSGTSLWTEDWLNNNAQGVQVTNGYFSVMLGAGADSVALSSLNFNQTPLWLSINIGGTNSSCATFSACGGDGEMLPFTQFAADAYAFNAAQVGGINASSLAVLSPASQQSGSLNVSGTITSGSTISASAATLTGSTALTLGSTSNAAALLFQDGTSNNRTVTVNTTGLSASYTLTLPTTGPTTAQCLQSGATTASQLIFGSCTTGNTLQTAYNNSTSSQQIVLNSTQGGLTIADSSGGLGTNLLQVESNGGSNYLSVSATGTNVGGTLGVSGATTLSSTLGVTSTTTLTGALNANGAANFENTTNSATAFQVQNAAGSDNSDNLLDLSTVYNTNNLVTNGSFEQDTSGWSAEGTGSAISQVTGVGAPFGNGAMQITTTGTPSVLAGAKFPVTMVSGDVYALSFYAKLVSGTFTDLSFGRADNGSTNTTCSTTATASTTDWLRFSCTFTPSTQTGSPYIFIGQDDTTTDRTWYIDGVSMEQVASGSFYKEGTLDLSGLALNNVLIQPTANTNETLEVANVAGVNGLNVNTDGSAISTSFAATFSSTVTESSTVTQSDTSTAALQVRNATSLAPVLKLDTSTVNNSDTNGGFENSTSTTTGYLSTKHAGSTLTVDTTAGNAYEGGNTGKVVTTTSAVADSGISYNLTTTTMASNTSYTLSFVAKLVTGQPAFTTLTAGRAENGSTETACILNSTSLSFQWQGYTCTFTTGTTSGTPYFYIGQTDAGVAHQYYIDDIQFTAASSTTANYHEGNIQLNGVITSPVTFQTSSDGTGAFQIQDAEGNNVLNIDTDTGNLVTNSGFENGAGFWLAKGTATVSPDSTAANVYQGDQSLKAAVTAATSGMTTSTFRLPITASTQYQLTFYARCDSSYSTLTYGRQDVSGTDVNSTTSGSCTTNWQQYTAHWTTGGTITNPNIYVDLGTTTSGTIWLDDVSLIQTTTSGATNYNNANIGLGGVVTSPTIFENGSNSTTAFQIQNASGTSLFVADTQDSRICIATATCTNTLGVNGTIAASGTITASTTPDISETIPASDDVEPEDVVSAGPDGNVDAVKSSVPYDPTAIGVISDGSSSFRINSNAGSINTADTGKYLVLAGRVPVHVTNEGGPIEPGDYLTTSSTPGYAMKADHAGPTIGKALAAFDGTSGSVMVQTNLSYYGGPTGGDQMQGGSDPLLTSLNVSGATTLASLTVTGTSSFEGDIAIDGHIVTGGSTPSVQAQAGAGTGATASVSGDDTLGTITITTGSNPAAGDLVQLNFSKAYGASPKVLFSAANASAAGLKFYRGTTTPSGVILDATSPPAADTTYQYDYFSAQ